jgi:fumarate reductase flavoprotein subunit
MGAMNIRTDIVVVGSGLTGLAAALSAAEAGAKVMLFEKMRSLGGSSNFPEGMFAVESEMQRQDSIGITRDDAFKRIMEYSHWRANPRLVRAFVDESAETIAWLQRHGVEFAGPRANWEDSPRTWHILKGPADQRGGPMIKALAQGARQAGVDIRLAAPVLTIVKEHGVITGVVAEENGEEVHAAARAVIIGTGGYANNGDWIRKYTGYELGRNVFPLGNVDKTGDGIRMAWEVGAAEEGMGLLQTLRVGPLLGPGVKFMQQLECVAMQPNLCVNQAGERYCDESMAPNFAFDGNALARLKEKQSYSIFDDGVKLDMMEKGVAVGMGMVRPPGTRFFELDTELSDLIEKGNPNVFVADSIEQLAEKIGVHPKRLRATLDEYNGYCEKGHDDLFAKDRKYLRPLRGPRFYAVRSYLAFLGTLGGIKINEHMEVLDKQDVPIPGLYAGGLDAGGMYGDSYDVIMSGGTSAFAANSGRIAGRNAVAYIRAA